MRTSRRRRSVRALNSHNVYGTPDAGTLDPGQGAGGFTLSGGGNNDTYVFGEATGTTPFT